MLASARRLAVALLVVLFALLFAAVPATSAAASDRTHDYDDGSKFFHRSSSAPETELTSVDGCLAWGDVQGSEGRLPLACGLVAPNSVPSPIGFAPGEGVSALVPNRLQHGSRHLIDEGVLPPWRGKTSPQQIQDALVPILENPTATFDNVLGGTAVRGFIGTVDGHTVAVQVFAEGPLAGQLATSVVPSANQLTKWGVTP